MYDVIGELGGVIEILTIVFGIIMFPFSQQSFILKASGKLFKARTIDSKLMAP